MISCYLIHFLLFVFIRSTYQDNVWEDIYQWFVWEIISGVTEGKRWRDIGVNSTEY